MNYYERHIGDYLKDTSHLSLLEHGVYTRLLDVYYTREGAIPEAEAARFVGARSPLERQALKAVLQEFFELRDGHWHQGRADAEIARFKDKQSKAKRSAEARWSAHRPQSEGNANAYADASPDAMRTHSEGNAPRARPQTPSTSNHSEAKLPQSGRGSRLPPDWTPGEPGIAFAAQQGLANGRALAELEKFRDYWAAQPGQKGVKLDWQATWRTWVRNTVERMGAQPGRLPADIYGEGA